MNNRKRMTESAIAARQRSAQLSTGPKTSIGKKHSSSNAWIHGFYSRELRVSEEDKPEFQALRATLFQQFAPGTALQTIATEIVVTCAWRCKPALRFETRTLETFSSVPDESSSQEAHPERDPSALQWYGANRSALRAGMRLLADLRVDISQNGGLHLAERKEQLVKIFGMDFYNDLESWTPMDVQAILMAESLAAHEKNFNLGPIPGLQPAAGVKIVVDEKQKLAMMLKLVDLQMQHLLDLRQTSTFTQSREAVLTDFIPRHFPTVSRDLQRAVDWFLYLKENHL